MKKFYKFIAYMLSLIMCISVFNISDIKLLTANAVESPIKPKITIDRLSLFYEEARYRDFVDVNITLSGENVNNNYCNTGFCIMFPDDASGYYTYQQLTVAENKDGSPAVKTGEAIENLTSHVEWCTDKYGNRNGIYLSTEGNSNAGKTGLMYTITFKFPDWVGGGEDFPLTIEYQDGDHFTNYENDETGKLMQDYLFTQGITDGRVHIDFMTTTYTDYYYTTTSKAINTTTNTTTSKTTNTTTSTTKTQMAFIKVPTIIAKPGEKIYADIIVSRPNMCCDYLKASMEIDCDSLLEIVDVKAGKAIISDSFNAEYDKNSVLLTTDGKNNMQDGSILYTLQLIVPEDTEAGVYPIRIKNINLIDDKNNRIDTIVMDGSITVNYPDVETTTTSTSTSTIRTTIYTTTSTTNPPVVTGTGYENWTMFEDTIVSIEDNKVTFANRGKISVMDNGSNMAMLKNAGVGSKVSVEAIVSPSGSILNIIGIDVLERAVTSGDATGDGEVNIADAVLIMQTLSNPDDYKLDEQQKANADVVNKGDGVTAMDALAIQLIGIKLITAEDLPLTTEQINNLTK